LARYNPLSVKDDDRNELYDEIKFFKHPNMDYGPKQREFKKISYAIAYQDLAKRIETRKSISSDLAGDEALRFFNVQSASPQRFMANSTQQKVITGLKAPISPEMDSDFQQTEFEQLKNAIFFDKDLTFMEYRKVVSRSRGIKQTLDAALDKKNAKKSVEEKIEAYFDKANINDLKGLQSKLSNFDAINPTREQITADLKDMLEEGIDDIDQVKQFLRNKHRLMYISGVPLKNIFSAPGHRTLRDPGKVYNMAWTIARNFRIYLNAHLTSGTTREEYKGNYQKLVKLFDSKFKNTGKTLQQFLREALEYSKNKYFSYIDPDEKDSDLIKVEDPTTWKKLIINVHLDDAGDAGDKDFGAVKCIELFDGNHRTTAFVWAMTYLARTYPALFDINTNTDEIGIIAQVLDRVKINEFPPLATVILIGGHIPNDYRRYPWFNEFVHGVIPRYVPMKTAETANNMGALTPQIAAEGGHLGIGPLNVGDLFANIYFENPKVTQILKAENQEEKAYELGVRLEEFRQKAAMINPNLCSIDPEAFHPDYRGASINKVILATKSFVKTMPGIKGNPVKERQFENLEVPYGEIVGGGR
jgi:hypothetical protein